jgi:hypothetical protein
MVAFLPGRRRPGGATAAETIPTPTHERRSEHDPAFDDLPALINTCCGKRSAADGEDATIDKGILMRMAGNRPDRRFAPAKAGCAHNHKPLRRTQSTRSRARFSNVPYRSGGCWETRNFREINGIVGRHSRKTEWVDQCEAVLVSRTSFRSALAGRRPSATGLATERSSAPRPAVSAGRQSRSGSKSCCSFYGTRFLPRW